MLYKTHTDSISFNTVSCEMYKKFAGMCIINWTMEDSIFYNGALTLV